MENTNSESYEIKGVRKEYRGERIVYVDNASKNNGKLGFRARYHIDNTNINGTVIGYSIIDLEEMLQRIADSA